MSSDDRPTVLVVEDDAGLADLYAAWLEDDYAVRTAYDGEEALSKLDGSVDVVLLDRRMPDLSGDDVLAEIEERELGCRVAMVTAVQPDVDIVGLGFDDYLVKPVEEKELRGVVERLLNRTVYDRRMREYFALVSKKATLEAEGAGGADLESSEEYATLKRRLEEVKSDLDDRLAEMAREDFAAVLRDISPDGSFDAGPGREE